jgi:hypothetical protein
MFIVLHYLFTKLGSSNKSNTLAAILALFSGLSLSMAELLRPFFIYLLPIPFLFSLLRFKKKSIASCLFFLAPILLFSGGWHVRTALLVKQLSWSNHSGFNMVRAWPEVTWPEYRK